MHFLQVPAAIVEAFGGGYKRRYRCAIHSKKKTPGPVVFPCGVMALGDGDGFIMLSKKRMQKSGVKEGDRPEVTLTVDSSRYGMPVPKEWKELLTQDPEGAALFEKLTPGKQRSIFHLISGVKNPVPRLEKAVRLLEELKESSADQKREPPPAIDGEIRFEDLAIARPKKKRK